VPNILTERYLEAMRANAKQYPQHTNRASSMGHPCLRHLVYCRTDWQNATMHGPEMQSIFSLGHHFEPFTEQALRLAGFNTFQAQRPLRITGRDGKTLITGHIDGMITCEELWGNQAHVYDGKSSSPYMWQSVETVDDIRNHKRWYVRGYYDQVQLYLIGLEETAEDTLGILVFVDKTTGIPKLIDFPLDLERCEYLIQRAEEIEQHLKDGTQPDRINYDHGVCGECPFRHLCVPDVSQAPGITFIEDDEIELLLGQRDATMEEHQTWTQAEKDLTAALKYRFEAGETQIVIGDWIITGKQDKRGSWRKNIEKLVAGESKDDAEG